MIALLWLGCAPDRDGGGDDDRPEDVAPDLPDADGDGVGDTSDLCPTVPDPDQADTDGDGVGDRCACGPTPVACVDGSSAG